MVSRFWTSLGFLMLFSRCLRRSVLILLILVTFCFNTASSRWIRDMHTLSCFDSCIFRENGLGLTSHANGGKTSVFLSFRLLSLLKAGSNENEHNSVFPFFCCEDSTLSYLFV